MHTVFWSFHARSLFKTILSSLLARSGAGLYLCVAAVYRDIMFYAGEVSADI